MGEKPLTRDEFEALLKTEDGKKILRAVIASEGTKKFRTGVSRLIFIVTLVFFITCNRVIGEIPKLWLICIELALGLAITSTSAYFAVSTGAGGKYIDYWKSFTWRTFLSISLSLCFFEASNRR